MDNIKMICFHCQEKIKDIEFTLTLQGMSDDYVQIYQWNYTESTNASLFFHPKCFTEIAGSYWVDILKTQQQTSRKK